MRFDDSVLCIEKNENRLIAYPTAIWVDYDAPHKAGQYVVSIFGDTLPLPPSTVHELIVVRCVHPSS